MGLNSFLLNYLRKLSPEKVKELCEAATNSFINSDDWFSRHEYEEVSEYITATDGQEYTSDGRIVFSGQSKKWALNKDVHDKKIKQELTQKANAKFTIIEADKDEWLSIFTCTRCGEPMQSEKVCPSCGIGKLGYKYRYSCVCGVEFISKVKI